MPGSLLRIIWIPVKEQVSDARVVANRMAGAFVLTCLIMPGSGIPRWPTYDASDAGTVMIFEEQKGRSISSAPTSLRKQVYDLWQAALG